MVTTALRVALLGGDARRVPGLEVSAHDIRLFGSADDCGTGECRRLVAAIRSGRVDLVVVMTRWIGHSASTRIAEECRRTRTPCRFWPRGYSGLIAALETGRVADR